MFMLPEIRVLSAVVGTVSKNSPYAAPAAIDRHHVRWPRPSSTVNSRTPLLLSIDGTHGHTDGHGTVTQMLTVEQRAIGNESVPTQLAQCWFTGLAISIGKI